jgi:mannose-6-phosphate isomerase-like protein (cupin superfamily)
MSTEITTKPYRVPAGEGLANFWWKTGRMTVKAGGAETGHAFAQIESFDLRGTATPLHVHHNEDEAFYVVEGEVTVLMAGERIDLGPGDYLFAPRDVPHTTIVTSESAQYITTISPAGLEDLFVELGVPVTAGEQPEEAALPPMPEVARRFGAYGVEILGPPLLLDDLS